MLDVLEQHDRTGEKNIAIFQACAGGLVLLFNLYFWIRGDLININLLAVVVAGTILLSCAFRYRMANSDILNNALLHVLSIVDGILIFMLVISQAIAFNMPIEASFASPSVIALILYSGVRIVRFDPLPIIIAGVVVVVGWVGLLAFGVYRNAEIATSYSEAVFSSKIFPAGQLEMSAGYVVFVLAMASAAKYSRSLLGKTAHVEDLEEANFKSTQSAKQLQSIFNNSPDGIVICDDHGKIIDNNHAFRRMLGYEDELLLNTDVATLISKKEIKNIISATQLKESEATGSWLKGKTVVTKAKSRSGQDIPVEISMSIFPRDGEQCFAIFVRDIRDRLEKEQNERLALSCFEQVVNSAMDAIIIIDEQNKITTFNPAAEAIFGHRAEKAVGQDLGQLIIPSRLRAAHNRGVKNYFETGIAPVLNQRNEVPALRADGQEIQIELTVRELDSVQGKMFIGYARDVSALNRVQKELVEAKEVAEEANKTKSRFLAMMSHEIRTPLNGVLGMMSVMEERLQREEDKNLVHSAIQSGESLMTILNDILDLSKLEAGKFDITPHDFRVDTLLDNVMNLIRRKGEEKGLELVCEIEEGVTPVLFGDADRIRQVLLNLAWNALKFTEKGKVVISAKPGRKGCTIFSVMDTGVGICDEEQSKLFQEFSMIKSANIDNFGGAGLGLAISRTLINSMDGRIWVSSKEGHGSNFQFELPLVPGNEAGIVESKSNEADLLDAVLPGLKILVAEDNSTNQLVVSQMLKNLDCEVDFVGNGSEAVDAVKKHNYNIVLMDISMPVMDGFEATRTIRALKDRTKAEIPIAALTAYAMKADREKILEAGMDHFLSKPVSRKELLKTLVLLGTPKLGKKAYVSGVSSQTPMEPVPASRDDFDPDILEELLSNMEKAERELILSHLEKDLKKFLHGLQSALRHRDIKAAESMTHGLKGVSGIFGATRLSGIACELNDEIRFLEEKGLSSLDDNICGQLTELIDFTQAHIDYMPQIRNEYLVA